MSRHMRKRLACKYGHGSTKCKTNRGLVKMTIRWEKVLKVKNSGKEQQNQHKKVKIADSVLLSLFMRDNCKCNISHASKHWLKQYSILYTKSIGGH